MIESLSVIDMFGPVYGEGWHGAEIGGGVSFRWSGPQTSAAVLIPCQGGGATRVRWTLAFLPEEEQLRAVSVAIGGRAAPLAWSVQGRSAAFWCDVELDPALTFTDAAFETPTKRRASDERLLGLAVSRVEVMRMATRAQPCSASDDQIRALTAQLSEIRRSTSWRVTAPARWLAATLRGGAGPA